MTAASLPGTFTPLAASIRILPLGQIADLRIGRTPSRSNSAYWTNATVPWVSIGDMNNGPLSSTKELISEAARSDCFAGGLAPVGTLLMSFKLSIGKLAITRVAVAHNEAIVGIYPHPDLADRDYLFYCLQHVDLLSDQDTYLKGKTLNKTKLAALPIPLPPLDEQRRTAATLTTIQRAQNAVTSEIRQLEVLKASYKAGFLSSYSKTSQVALGSLRCSISTGPFGSQLHASDYVPIGVRVLNPMHLLSNGVVDGPTPCVNEHTATRLERHKLRVGDVIIPRRGELSRYARVDERIAGSLCGTGCMVIRLEDQRINGDYFATYFGSENAQAYLRDAATGTIMPNINPKILEAMPIPLPSRALQDEFVKGCDAIDCGLKAADNKTKVVSRVYDSALALLFGTQR